MTSGSDPYAEFRAAAGTAGLEIKGDIDADGKIHRCHVLGDGKGKKNGWYVLFLDGIAAGSFGSWKTGQTTTWCAKSDKQLSKAERIENKRRMNEARALREAEEVVVRVAAKEKAEKLWNRAGSVDAKYEYILKKGIKPVGAKQLRNMLVLPLHDIDGVLHSLQFIYPDGSKRFLTGGRKKGCFTRLPGRRKDFPVAYVVEGWATGCSVRAAIDENIFVCFDAGNLLPVCQDIRKAFPDVKIVICADDDYQTDGNPGITKAVEVAEIVSGFVAKPDFGDERPDGATDFNDLHQHLGIDAVLRDLDSAVDYSVVDEKKKPAKLRKKKKQDPDGLIIRSGNVYPCVSNVYLLLDADPDWEGVLSFNEFTYGIDKLKPPPFAGGEVGEWTDRDTGKAMLWISAKHNFAPTDGHVIRAVELLSKESSHHPVRDYLASLEWDGTRRADDWVTDYIGAPKNDYVMRVSRWFLMGLVARVIEPGVKFDYCLVLEGDQGKKKSTALRVLGGEWFGDTDLDLSNKDSMLSIRGKWIYEFAELGSFSRTETRREKSFLSRLVDEFRPPYARENIRSPRQLVFGGTTNEESWNKDGSGGRRFWPIKCGHEIDCDGLADVRDQLFAEAYALYKSGKKFWPTAEEQKTIFTPMQEPLNQADTYVDLLHDWVNQQVSMFSLADAAYELKIDAARQTRDIQTRVGAALKKLGCVRKEKRTQLVRYWYQPPEKSTEHSTTSGEDDGYVDF